MTNLKQSKLENKKWNKLLKNREKVDTLLLKTDEKQDDVVQSKAGAFLKAAMQKEKALEGLTIAQSKIETDLKTMT